MLLFWWTALRTRGHFGAFDFRSSSSFAENFTVVRGKNYSLEEEMGKIVSEIEKQTVIDFLDYFNARETLEEAVVAFFSLLELIKARLVLAVQEQLFHTIKVWLRKDRAARSER